MQKIVMLFLGLFLGVFMGQAFSEGAVVEGKKPATDSNFQKIMRSDHSYPILLMLNEAEPGVYGVTRDIYQMNQLDKVTRQLHLLVVQQRRTNQLLQERVMVTN